MEKIRGSFKKDLVAVGRKKPLYRQIADMLRERIADEVWAPDEALPSRRALAKEMGTTHITVDKAVAQLVKEGLLSATIGSGTYVNRRFTELPVQAVRRPRTRRVGIVLGAMTFKPQETNLAKEHIYFGNLLNGIQDGFLGCDVELNYEGIMLSDSDRLKALDFDGLLVICPSLYDLEPVRSLSKEFSLVAIGFSSNMLPEEEKLPCVDTGNPHGGYLAAKHLIDLGHRDIGCITLSFNSSNHYDRYNGFLGALEEARLKIAPEHLLMSPFYYTQIPVEQTIDPWIERLANMSRLPSAIVAFDFTTTMTLLECLEQRGISVPADISVVGYDDGPRFEHRATPVTAIYQPTYELGRRAAERLLMNLDGPAENLNIGTEQLIPEIHIRATTGPCHRK